ncbi:MAG: type II toxin-antitoxin system VapB family antitoxin [Candidatus Solibacter usitatus]|nr:type II toxin-antitoxin system VapB family antitoxin [Candidatus Solibacter usitatus]
MALTIRNKQVERLIAEVALLAGETKTEALRKSLLERKERLQLEQGVSGNRNLLLLLETHIWPTIPAEILGTGLTKQEEEELLGYGPHGV